MLGIKPLIPDTPDIKQYHAVFTQVGTSTPVVTVLHSTLEGTITWARTNLGVYTGTSDLAEFTAGKTLMLPYGGEDAGGRLPVRPISLVTTGVVLAQLKRDSTTDIVLRCYSALNTSTLKEYSDVGGTIPIMVYIYK